jgi:sugar O-acyltransferase (sialic acid O-acetyltransferase NeuD family)
MKIALVGYGALGKYMRDVIAEYRGAKDFTAFDDVAHREGAANALPFADHVKDEFAGHEFYVCLGYKHAKAREGILARLARLGRTLPHFVHPSSYAHASVKLGRGVFLYPGVNIDRNTVVGDGTWLSNGTVIAHDCKVGGACWFGASVTLCGEVTVGSRTFLGSGSTISNDLTVGSDVVVGLATAVTKPVADGQSVIGNPMRILERPIQLQ